jgi:hypothetical protein
VKNKPYLRLETVEEATALIENGFQYVDTVDGTKLYKKRK